MKEMEGTESFLHAIHLSIHPPTQAILFLVVGVCEFDQSLTQHLELYNPNKLWSEGCSHEYRTFRAGLSNKQ